MLDDVVALRLAWRSTSPARSLNAVCKRQRHETAERRTRVSSRRREPRERFAHRRRDLRGPPGLHVHHHVAHLPLDEQLVQLAAQGATVAQMAETVGLSARGVGYRLRAEPKPG